MTVEKPMAPLPSSAQLAADASLIPVWDPMVPFPSPKQMCDLDVVTHVSVERAQPGIYHYLHESTIVWHRDRFYVGWANHPLLEDNNRDEIVRGKTSVDGIHWSESSVWVQAPQNSASSFNHPLIFSHDGKLYGFFVAWHNGQPTTEVFIHDDIADKWQYQRNCDIPGFLPFCTPQPMTDGNWIIGGEYGWYESAVIISNGANLTQWEVVMIPRPEDIKILYPETALVNQKDRILAICRPNAKFNREAPHVVYPPDEEMLTAPVSESRDCGRTWTPLGMSNFPLTASMPFSGRLSTGQNYLLTNSLAMEEGRSLLSIAVTGSEGGLFQRIFKVRHQDWPSRRLFGGYGAESYVGTFTEWSYPKAFEHNGCLYIVYTQGKEDCALSIIPIVALAV